MQHLKYSIQLKTTIIYYIKLQFSLSVSLSVPPPLFSTRPSDRNQIWHTYSGRYGTHSELRKIYPPQRGLMGVLEFF